MSSFEGSASNVLVPPLEVASAGFKTEEGKDNYIRGSWPGKGALKKRITRCVLQGFLSPNCCAYVFSTSYRAERTSQNNTAIEEGHRMVSILAVVEETTLPN